MGITNAKGELGEAVIFADLQRQGHGVAIPWGHDLPFDLIVVPGGRRPGESPVQIHHVGWSSCVRHGDEQLGLGAPSIYPRRGGLDRCLRRHDRSCFYLPSSVWDGQVLVNLRLVPTANGQAKGIRFAHDFTRLTGDPELHHRLAQGRRAIYHWASRRSSSVVERGSRKA